MDNSIKILMIEDVPDEAELVKRALRSDGISFEARRVDSKEDYLKVLHEFEPDVILSDHTLPQFSSTEALSITRQQSSSLPFILVTGTVSEEYAVQCLKNGADDYVLKSNLSRLPNAVRTAMHKRYLEKLKKRDEEFIRMQNEDLKKMKQEIDSFVYSLSHNLRSPLLSVKGLVNIVKLETAEIFPDVNPALELIDKRIADLDRTIKEIQAYFRNARSELSISKINIEDLINRSFEQLSFHPIFNHIKKDVVIDGQAGFYSDEYRISVILVNLISNAIKYYDPGKTEKFIRINARTTSNELTLTIEDNGIGILDIYITHVSDMFFRATERSDGSGLGLYIVQEMVNRLNGKIDIESVAGESTTITLTIPNARDDGNKISENEIGKNTEITYLI